MSEFKMFDVCFAFLHNQHFRDAVLNVKAEKC